MSTLENKICSKATELGFDDCRFTSTDQPQSKDRLLAWLSGGYQAGMQWMATERNIRCRLNPSELLPGVKSIICLAVSYYTSPSNEINLNRVARYARIGDYHELLTSPLKELASYVDSITPNCATPAKGYLDTAPILERNLAQRAGIGFVGKHNNLISPKLGNWFVLAEIFTTLELNPTPPMNNHCGTCTRCLEACPTGALTASTLLDARRCLSYLTIENKGEIPSEFHAAMGEKVFGCDRCLEACPWNRFAHTSHMANMAETPPATQTFCSSSIQKNIQQLEQMSDTEFKKRFAGTPLLRAKRSGLLRNLHAVTKQNAV